MNLGDQMKGVQDVAKAAGVRISDDALVLAAAILQMADRLRDLAEELPADD